MHVNVSAEPIGSAPGRYLETRGLRELAEFLDGFTDLPDLYLVSSGRYLDIQVSAHRGTSEADRIAAVDRVLAAVGGHAKINSEINQYTGVGTLSGFQLHVYTTVSPVEGVRL